MTDHLTVDFIVQEIRALPGDWEGVARDIRTIEMRRDKIRADQDRMTELSRAFTSDNGTHERVAALYAQALKRMGFVDEGIVPTTAEVHLCSDTLQGQKRSGGPDQRLRTLLNGAAEYNRPLGIDRLSALGPDNICGPLIDALAKSQALVILTDTPRGMERIFKREPDLERILSSKHLREGAPTQANGAPKNGRKPKA